MDSSEAQAVLERAGAENWQPGRLTLRDLNTQPTTPDELSLFAEFKAETALEVVEGEPVDLHLTAHETYDDDGNANEETVSLSHDLVDAPSVRNDVVVFRDGTAIDPVSVDYGADEVTIDTNGNNETYDLYYVSGDQARAVLRIKAPRNVHHEPAEKDAGLANMRDQGKDPVTFEWSTALDGLVPTDWRVQVMVEAPYEVEYENDTRAGAKATNALLSLPIMKAAGEIEGLGALKNEAIGTVDGM